MGVARWKDEYLIHVEEIDEQHKKWIEMIDEFYASLEAKGGKTATGELLAGMLDYTKYHFGTEERLMVQYGYAEYESHRAQHQAFISKMTDTDDRFRKGLLVISLEVTNYLKDWLINHILLQDKKFGAFLNGKGVH